MLAKRLVLTLRVGAIVFALSALALFVAPQSFLEFLKIEKGPVGYSEEIVWAMRMMGVCLLIASVMMPLVWDFNLSTGWTMTKPSPSFHPISPAIT
jgi:O-antigen/teichoic acid export membrane protein